ncbi:MAG: DEAD/DEAH box helicase [Proteobacteria bacterium]|nr:DEAD/DEAH box helicase [Pseudomonadota bacterium]
MPSSVEKIWKSFDRSSPLEQDILVVLAVHYEPITQTDLSNALSGLGKPGSSINKTWREKMLQLQLIGIHQSRLVCNELLSNQLAFEAIKKGSYEKIYAIGDRTAAFYSRYDSWRYDYFHYDPWRYKRLLRHALLHHDTPAFCDLMKIKEPFAPPPPDRMRILFEVAAPRDADWFYSMTPAFQYQALKYPLDHCQHHLVNAPVLYDILLNCASSDPDPDTPLRTLLAEQDLFRLDTAAFKANSGMASPSPDLTALHAAQQFLAGDYEQSCANFALAVAAKKKATRKRNIRFEGLVGLIYCLTLVKAGGADNEALLKGQAAASSTRDVYEPLRFCFEMLGEFRKVWDGRQDQGEFIARLEYGYLDFEYPASQLVQALMFHWLDQPVPKELRTALETIVDKATETPSLWPAGEAPLLLAAIAGAPPQGLAAMMPKLASWERALDALLALSPAERTTAHPKQTVESRLIWMLYREQGQLRLEPREQKPRKNGGWTKGRTVSLTRLLENPDEFAMLTPEDERICHHIRPNLYGYPSYHLPVGHALAAAAGHPLVFWKDAPDQPVEVTSRSPELIVKQASDHVTLTMYPSPDQDSDDEQWDLESALDTEVLIERPGAIDVYHFSEQHRHIARIIDGELKVPAAAKDRVLESIMSISPLITVHSDLPGVDADMTETVEADATLTINVQPEGDTLRLDIAVTPFGQGPRFLPGAGGETVFAEINGERMQTRRDLAGESRRLQALLACCPGLQQQRAGIWLFDDLEQSLEGLMAISEMDDAPVLAWPEGKQIRLHETAGVSAVSLSIRKQNSWFDVDGELQVGEADVLNMGKLLTLIGDSAGRFVRLGDNEFMALTDELRKRLEQLRAISSNGRVHGLAGIHLEEATEGMSLDADDHWQSFRDRLQTARDFEPAIPTTLEADLRDYQQDGFRWLARLSAWGAGACLADDMGLGKTLQSLALVLTRARTGPTLVLAPTSVCANWVEEIHRFAPTLNALVFGDGDRESVLATLGPFDVLIVSYGLLASESERLTDVDWCTIIADEAQAFKNANTLRSKAVMKLSAPFKMITTGTPIENHLGELWNLFNFINPGLLGSLDQFATRFARPIENGDADARAALRNLLQPFILRRLKNDVLSELPPRTDITLLVELSREEAALYEALRREAAASVMSAESDQQQRMIALAHITRLRQVVCNPALVMPEAGISSSKLAMFASVIDELRENRHKVLVFSQFVRHLTLVRTYLDEQAIPYQYLDGSMRPAERKKAVAAFQDGEGDVFLISLKAGGMGLNLTAANYVIHLDPWWNPAVEDQASDRAHRLGQQRPVTVYRLVAADTIEQKIVELHQHKRDLAEGLLEGTDMGSRMTFDDMLALIGQGAPGSG